MHVYKCFDPPNKRGVKVGKIIITDQGLGKVVKEVPLLALEDVGEGGWWRKAVDAIQKFFTD